MKGQNKMEEAKKISIEGKLELCAEGKGLRQKVKLRVLNNKENRNGGKFVNLRENVFDPVTGLANTPILCAYVGDKIGDRHNFRLTRDENGDEVADFTYSTAERIVGIVPKKDDIEISTEGDTEWVDCTGVIFAWYAAQLVAKLKETGSLSVSIETLIYEMHKEEDIEVFTKYAFLGTTILGDDVTPAVASANIRALAALGSEGVKELTLKVASYEGESEEKTNGLAKKQKNERKTTQMRVKDVAKAFPDFTVLGVNGVKVALLSADGGVKLSTAEKNGNETVIGAKVDASAVVTLTAGEDSVEFPLDAILETLNAKVTALSTELEDEKSAHRTVLEALETMQTAERDRRLEAVKNAVKECCRDLAACSGGVVSESELCAIFTDERVCEFAALEKDGKFIGDAEACKELKAYCMSKIEEAAKIKTNSAKRKYTWEVGAGNESAEGDNLYAKFTN